MQLQHRQLLHARQAPQHVRLVRRGVTRTEVNGVLQHEARELREGLQQRQLAQQRGILLVRLRDGEVAEAHEGAESLHKGWRVVEVQLGEAAEAAQVLWAVWGGGGVMVRMHRANGAKMIHGSSAKHAHAYLGRP